MPNATGTDYFADRTFLSVWRWMTAFVCLSQLAYVLTQFWRNWNTFGPYSRVMAVVFVLAYPVPCLIQFRKSPNPFQIAMFTYVAILSMAIFLMFPTAR